MPIKMRWSNIQIRKKAVYFIIIVVVIAAGVAGYLFTPQMSMMTSRKSIRLKYYDISWQVDYINEKIAEFNEEHTGIEVEFVPLAAYEKEIVPVLMSGEADLAREPYGHLSEYVEAGWATDITGLPELDELKTQLEPEFINEYLYRGKEYGLDAFSYLQCMLYNERYLAEAGVEHPPATLDELVQQSLAIKEKGIVKYPLALHLYGSERRIDWTWYMFNLMQGGPENTLYDEDWKPTYMTEDSPGYKSLQFIIDCIHEWKILDPAAVEWDTFKVVDILMKGDTAFASAMVFHMPVANEPVKSPEAGNIRIMLIPGTHYTFTKSELIFITEACRDKGEDYYEAAWQFLKWYCGPPFRKPFIKIAGPMTAYATINNDPEVRDAWSKYMNLDEFDKQRQFAISLKKFNPIHETIIYTPWINDYCIPNLQKAVAREITIEEALQNINQGFLTLAEQYYPETGLPPYPF